jgi:TrmH family RNA methyltransferase
MKKYHKQDLRSYSLGITLTFELLDHKISSVTKVYIHSQMDKNETFINLNNICNHHNIPIEFNDKVFNILSQKENCYVIGEFMKYETLLDQQRPHVVLVNPSNAGNLGTIIRSLIGFGINNLAIITPAVDIFDPKVIRASMGAIFKVNFQYFEHFEDYQNCIPVREMFPFMLQTNQSLNNIKHSEVYSLIFGNEASGLPLSFLEIGQPLKIIHTKEIDSLNLPMAVTIALYEMTKNTFK